MVTVKLEIPAYLVKFLHKSYGINFHAKRSSDLGYILMDYLQKDYVRDSVKDNTNCYKFHLTTQLAKKYGSFISPENQKCLIKKLDSLFKIALYAYVDVSVGVELEYTRSSLPNLKQSRFVAFKQFLAYHGITEDDLKLESVYRRDLRKRNTLEKYKKQPVTIKKTSPKKVVSKRKKIGHKKNNSKTTPNQTSLFAGLFCDTSVQNTSLS